MPKKLSEFTSQITELQDTDRILVARGTSGVDYYTTMADILAYINLNSVPPELSADYVALLSGTYSSPELEAISAFFTSLNEDTLASGGTMLELNGFWFRATDNVADSTLEINGGSSLTDDFSGWSFTAREGVSNQFATLTNSNTAISGLTGLAGSYLREAFSGGEPIANTGASFSFAGSDFGAGGNARFTSNFNDSGDKTFDFGFIFSGGSVSTYRDSTQVNVVVNQTANTPQNITLDTQSSGNITFSSEGTLQTAAHWYDSRVWTASEVQRFHGYIEALMDAFGAGVVS